MDERPAGRIPAGPDPETRFTDLARFIEEDTTRRRLDRGPAWLLIITGIGCLLLGGLFYAAKYSGHNVTAEVLSVGPCSASAATCTVEVGYHAGTRWVDAAITGVARMDIHGRPGHRTLYISYQPGAVTSPSNNDMPDWVWIGSLATGAVFVGLGAWWRRWQKTYARRCAAEPAARPPAGAPAADAGPLAPVSQPSPAGPARIAERDPRWLAMVTSVCVAALPALYAVQGSHTPAAFTIGLGVLGAGAGLWAVVRAWRIALLPEPGCLVVRNHLRTYRLRWGEIAEFTDGRMSGGEAGVMWALRIRLTDERAITARATGRVRAARPATAKAIAAIARDHGIPESLTGRPASRSLRNRRARPHAAAATGPPADAASRARQAQVLFAVLLTAGAITLAGSLALFNWGTHHHNNYTWSGLTFWIGVLLLSLAWGAWTRHRDFRKIDRAENSAPGHADTADSTASPPGEPGEGLGGAGGDIQGRRGHNSRGGRPGARRGAHSG